MKKSKTPTNFCKLDNSTKKIQKSKALLWIEKLQNFTDINDLNYSAP